MVCLVGSWGLVLLYDAHSGLCKQRLNLGVDIDPVALSPDGTTIALGSMETVHLWDTSEPHKMRSYKFSKGAHVVSIAFSPDGLKLAVLSSHSRIFIWSVPKGILEYEKYVIDTDISELSFSTTGNLYGNGYLMHRFNGNDDVDNSALAFEGDWLICGKARLLWLPPDYRSYKSIFRDLVVLRHDSGRHMMLQVGDLDTLGLVH